jgi:hypothetical protein
MVFLNGQFYTPVVNSTETPFDIHPSFDSCSRSVIHDDGIDTHRAVVDAHRNDLAFIVPATNYVIVEKNPSVSNSHLPTGDFEH